MSFIKYIADGLADGPYALEIWTALFVAFSVHLVVHIGQGIIIRGYVPGLITSILLLRYSYYGISCICQEMNSGKLILLRVIGFITIAINLWFAYWLGKKFFSHEKRTSSSGNSPATIFFHNTSKSQKLLERD
jgi:hypothetical protein